MNAKHIVTVNSYINYENCTYHVIHALCSVDDPQKAWLKWEDVVSCLQLTKQDLYWNVITTINMDQFPNVVWPFNWKDFTPVIAVDDVKRVFFKEFPDFVAWLDLTYDNKTEATTERIEKQIQAIDNKLTSIILTPAANAVESRNGLCIHRLDRGRFKFTRGKMENIMRQANKIQKKFPGATRFFYKYPAPNADEAVTRFLIYLWKKGYMASSRFNEVFFTANDEEEEDDVAHHAFKALFA